MTRWPLHTQVALALLAAVAVGAAVPAQGVFVEVCAFLGTLFLNALKLLIVPLVLSSMIGALLNLGTGSALSRLGLRTVLYFALTTLAAILTGLLFINLLQPGIIDGVAAGPRLGLSADTASVLEKIQHRGGDDIAAVVLRTVPPNLIEAAANGEMLGLIFFGLVFGWIAARLPAELAQTQRLFWEGINQAMLRFTGLVMRLAPLGVFALVGKTVAQTGWGALAPLALFFFCVVAGLATHLFLTLSLFLRACGVAPVAHLRAMAPVLLTAFSTSSSNATLPVTLETVQTRAGVPPGIAGFVLPLGATVNMNGTALYECAAALFIAQAYGLDLSLTVQFTVVALALVTSVGVAGIPSASLVAIAVILSSVGLPLEGIGLILAVDRVLDMCRTALNVYGDTVCAAILAKQEAGRVETLA